MYAQIKRTTQLFLASSTLLVGSTQALDAPQTSPVPSSIQSIVSKAPEARAKRLLQVLEGYGPVLAILPLDALKSVELGSDSLEFQFDFGRKKTREVKLQSAKRWVQTSRGKVKSVRGDSHRFIVSKNLRFQLDERGICAVRKGDLAIGWAWTSFDLSLCTVSEKGKQACDSDGRVILELNPDGKPRRVGGKVVPLTADRWAVFKARGRKVEIPLG